MISRRPMVTLLTTLILGAGIVNLPAQTKRPDFSGQWEQDTDASKALTEKKGHVWRVAGAGAGGAASDGRGATPPPGATVLKPVITITQSESEIVLERRFEDEIINRDAYKLDGSLSVNASRNSSSRSTTVWKGASLVTTGTRQFDFSSMQAADANGKPITEIVEQFVATRTLVPDGTMQVESRTTRNGVERVTWSVMVRKKS